MHSVGVPWYKRLWGVLRRFRDANQRMHDKTVIVDGELAITGGRNMADEYYDYDRAYNFRDRDALVIGKAAASVQASFDLFWSSPHTVPLEQQLPAKVLRRYQAGAERDEVYAELRAHAADPANFAPEVRAAIASIPESFPRLAEQLSEQCPTCGQRTIALLRTRDHGALLVRRVCRSCRAEWPASGGDPQPDRRDGPTDRRRAPRTDRRKTGAFSSRH
jgi:phosphatidylserine/phosphatidylglycerophosphate/cardiolipin synthase-like enzyme